MGEKNCQLAIINPEVPDNYMFSRDTVTIHTFSTKDPIHTTSLNTVSLICDANVQCHFQLCISSEVNISFLTDVPPSYEYEILLYYVNMANKLVYVGDVQVKNVKKNDVFSIECSTVFETRPYPNKFCTKISRKDVLSDFIKKPALLLSTQVTDCSLLFENVALTNFVIIVEDTMFRVHKEILAAKSSVFLSMFESEMKEKKENEVTIVDIEAKIFQEFLRYIYTNTVNDLNVNAEKLLMVAEKYDVAKLKSVCIDELSRSLKVENAVHLLMLSDKYGLKCLKERALGFMRNHMKLIVDTEEYKTLYKSEQAYLLQEILLLFL